MKSKVVASEKAVEDYRSANNLMVSQGVTLNDQQITDLNNKLIAARVQTAEARAKYEQVQDIAKSGGDPGGINAAISSEMITKLRTQYADIAKNEADLSSKYGARHPLVANVRAQRRDTQRLINEEIRRILESTKHDYDVARSREASLTQSLDQLQGVSTSSGQAQVRLRELQREAEANRTQYESYLARSKETTAQESLEMPDSRIVTKASIPIRPSSPKSMLILGLAVMLGLGAGSVLAFLADYLDGRVKTLEQAEAIAGVPALAAVPLIGARELARLARRGRSELGRYDPKATGLLPPALQPPLMRYAIEEPGTFFAEAIRAVRLALQRTMRSQPVKVVLVTSALDSEGKTTLAINLAQSLAMLGIRTLLIDGDLRNPQVTRALCPRADAGLLEVAIGQVAAGARHSGGSQHRTFDFAVHPHQGSRIHHGADVLRPDRRRSRLLPPPLRIDRDRFAAAGAPGRWPRACRTGRSHHPGAGLGPDPGRSAVACHGPAGPGPRPDHGHGVDPRRSQPPAVLRLLPQLGLSQAIRRREPAMPERRGENARTVERTDRRGTGASPPPCVTGAAAGFPCTSARRECPTRSSNGSRPA